MTNILFSIFFKQGASKSIQSDPNSLGPSASISFRVLDFLIYLLLRSSYSFSCVKRFFSRSVTLLEEDGRILELEVSVEKLVDVLLFIWGSLSGLSAFLSFVCFIEIQQQNEFLFIICYTQFWKQIDFKSPKMFDEDDYYSDQEENIMFSNKHAASSKVLAPNTGSQFNHLAGQGDSLMKIMKERGLDLTENEVKKIKQSKGREKSQVKVKPKTGFFDGGDKATVEELIKALNKSFSQADPQQASCILSYILEKKNLSPEHRNKFSIMKCNILFGLGAYEDCLTKAQTFLQKTENKLSAAIYSNLMAKCKCQTEKILSGYMDYLRSKSLLEEYKEQIQTQSRQKALQESSQEGDKEKEKEKESDEYAESEIDTTAREINHTQLEYNIKMSKYKNSTNLIFPYFPEFRHRKVLQVVCGDFHTLFLVGGSLGVNQSKDTNYLWNTEVFGFGQNTVGQITGKQRKVIYKEPVLISQLSGKGIEGVWASRQSSLAYDRNGGIYEWGIKQKRNQVIEITYTVGQEISKLEKGYRHYALLTKSGKFYSWGYIEMKGVSIYSQAKPNMQESKNIVDFSCGSHHTIAVDSSGEAYALGSNDSFQLGMPTERLAKNFRKIDNNMIGEVTKPFCINECTFLVNSDCEVFFCGRHSLKKQPQEKFRQAEFGEDFKDIIAITGSIGNYYVTNEKGDCYKWSVDTMVKFKLDRQNEHVTQRYVEACRGTVLKVRSMIKPQSCKVTRITEEPKTYESIQYQLTLKDQFGLYGVPDFIIPPRCQIFLSTYKAKKQQLLNQNKLFLQGHNFCTTSNKILLNEVVQNRLLQFEMTRSPEEPWLARLKILVETSGRYYFYIILEQTLILQQQLNIQVSEREKELEDKNKQDRLLKQEERKRKAELQRQRLAEEKMRKQMEEEERRKETQRRAEQALKKHMREQEQAKLRDQQERKARKQLMTGGGFDLTKLKKKSSLEFAGGTSYVSQKPQRVEKLEKTGQSFLPDINVRPSSRKKTTLPKPSELISSLNKQKPQPILKSSITDFSSTGFSINNPSPGTNQRPMTPKREPIMSAITSVSSNALKGSQPKPAIAKRGLSKKKN